MSREEIQNLLGRYASGTLSAEERQALMEAALEDQELFDALAREEALRDVLEDPAARAQLLAALGPSHPRFWLWRPRRLAMAGGLAALLIVAGVMLVRRQPSRQETLVAEAVAQRQPAPVPQATPAIVRQPVVRRKAVRLAEPAPATPHPPAPLPPAPLLAAVPPTSTGASSATPAAAPVAPPPPLPAVPSPAEALSAFASQNAPVAGRLVRAKASHAAGRPLEYNLLVAGPDGAYASAPAGAVFHPGDSVRLKVVPPAPGQLVLYQLEAGGGMNLIESQPVEPAREYVLPSSGGVQSDKPAQVKLMLMLMPRAQAAQRFQNTDGVTLPQPLAGQAVKITLEFH